MVQPFKAAEQASPPGQRPVLAFLHIPKTGGTTLGGIIKRNVSGPAYQISGIFTRHDLLKTEFHRFLALSQQERDQFNVLLGHLPMGIHQTVSRRCRYVALVRDPLKRAISNYFQMAQNKEGFAHEAIKSGKLPLQKFLEDGTRSLNNSVVGNDNMTKWLLGVDLFDEKPDWQRLGQESFGVELQEQLRQAWFYKPLPPGALEQVKANLRDHFMLIGQVDRFADFVFLLFEKLGLRPTPHYRLMNKTQSKPDEVALHPDTVSVFLERNSLDVALYAYIGQLFEQQWAELGVSEKGRACRYRWAQGCYQKILRGGGGGVPSY